MKKKLTFSGFTVFASLIFLLVSQPILAQKTLSKKEKKVKELKVTYPHTTFWYRGVVCMDADNNGLDEIFCDFGSNGVWVYNGAWFKITSMNPDWIISFQSRGTQYLLGDFNMSGLWYWCYTGIWNGAWYKISDSDALSAFVTDDDNDGDQEVHINFLGSGLWRYDREGGTWRQLSSLNSSGTSLRMDTNTPGYEEGAHDFNALGLWQYYYLAGDSWTKLNSADPADDHCSAEVGTGDPAEELIVDFDTLGLWILDGQNHTWHKLNSLAPLDVRPVKFVESPDYEILASFSGAAGLWYWNYSGYPGTWTKINSNTPDTNGGFCEPFDPNGNSEGNGDEEVAVDFGSLGLWLFDYSTSSWTKLSSSNPEFMVRCDYYSDGYKTGLVVDFGPGIGLWYYDGLNNWWFKLNALSPDGVN